MCDLKGEERGGEWGVGGFVRVWDEEYVMWVEVWVCVGVKSM